MARLPAYADSMLEGRIFAYIAGFDLTRGSIFSYRNAELPRIPFGGTAVVIRLLQLPDSQAAAAFLAVD